MIVPPQATRIPVEPDLIPITWKVIKYFGIIISLNSNSPTMAAQGHAPGSLSTPFTIRSSFLIPQRPSNGGIVVVVVVVVVLLVVVVVLLVVVVVLLVVVPKVGLDVGLVGLGGRLLEAQQRV